MLNKKVLLIFLRKKSIGKFDPKKCIIIKSKFDCYYCSALNLILASFKIVVKHMKVKIRNSKML